MGSGASTQQGRGASPYPGGEEPSSFWNKFREECTKVQAQIDKRLESTFQEMLLERQKEEGRELSEEEKAALRQTVQENDDKSHPAWDAQEGLSEVLAKALSTSLVKGFLPDGGCPKNMEIAFANGLAQETPASILKQFQSQQLLETLADQLHREAVNISKEVAATGTGVNDKFAVTTNDSFIATCRSTAKFSMSLERQIGSPNPNLLVGMIWEHCSSCESHREWTSRHYGITTTSWKEFLLVLMEMIKQITEGADGEFPAAWKDAAAFLSSSQAALPALSEWPTEWPKETKNIEQGGGRAPEAQQFLKELVKLNMGLASLGEKELMLEEGIMLRLATGPLREKYDAVLRGGSLEGCDNKSMEQQFREMCCQDGIENRYPTSIHVLSSGVFKLSMLSGSATVYRGIVGDALPKPFRVPDKFGCKGGVDVGFMSATRHRNAAAQSPGNTSVRMVLEIEMGMFDRGADLRTLSQYPEEAEVLFPPRTSLEVLGTKSERGVVLVKTRPTVDPKGETIDKVISKRYQVLKTMAEAVSIEVGQVLRSAMWPKLLAGWEKDSSWVDAQLLRDFQKVLQTKMKDIMSAKATAYNEDSTFLSATSSLVQLQADCKLQNSSLLHDVAAEVKHERLLELAKTREALEVKKQTVSLSFEANQKGTTSLWLFDAIGFAKGAFGLYHPSKTSDKYRETLTLDMVDVNTKDVELPGSDWTLLAINGGRDLQRQARALQSEWRWEAEMKMELELCQPTSPQDFTAALRAALGQEADAIEIGHLAQLLLSNSKCEELDLLDAALDDEQGAQFMKSLSLVGQHLTNLEVLILAGNKFKTKTMLGLADALRAGALPKLRQLRCFNNPLGEDMPSLTKLLSALAEHSTSLKVLTLDDTSMSSLETSDSESFTMSFGKLFQRLETFDTGPNKKLDSSVGKSIAAGLAAAATAASAAKGLSINAANAQLGTETETSPQSLPLKTLRLSICPNLFAEIGKEGMGDLSQGLAQCHVLEELDFFNAGLTSSAGAGEAFAEALSKCAKLQTLWLYNNPKLFEGDPAASAALCRAIGSLCNLEELHLTNAGLTSGAGAGDALAEALPKCPKLRVLELERNSALDEADQQRIREAVEARKGGGEVTAIEEFEI